MNFKILVALPHSDKFVEYTPDQNIRQKITNLLIAKKTSSNMVELKIDHMSMFFLDIKDDDSNIGYITNHNVVIYKIKWYEHFRNFADIKKMKEYLTERGVKNISTWKLYWIASLYDEWIYSYNRYKFADKNEKTYLAKKILSIRYELMLLYSGK
jgi:hypothetical protein